MKKIITIIMLVFTSINNINAEECTYAMKKELNTLGSYIDYDYKYNEDKNNFTITIYNISERLEIRNNGETKTTDTGKIEYTNLSGGESLNLNIYSKSTDTCYDEYLRAINITVPYVNPYYQSVLCGGKENLTVCNSKYLEYNITYEIFLKLIEDKETEIPETDDVPVENDSTIDYSVIQSYIIKISLVLLSLSITFIIFNKIYVNTKHRL